MVVNLRTSAKSEVKFVVVPNGFTNLLGLKTIQELGFITINEECFISQIKVPQLGEVTLRIDENAQPKVLPCRKIPLVIEESVHERRIGSIGRKRCTCSCDGTNRVDQ